jgi:hypothetical protein
VTPSRRTATVAGVLYLVTHVTSIAALVLYGPVLNHADYVLGGGPDTRILIGALLEVVLAMAVIGTAVTLFPVVKRHASLMTASQALVAVHDWTFLFGPDLVLGTNTVLLAYLLYRSRLVPRFIPILGLIGGPLVFVAAIGVLFGLYAQVSAPAAGAAVPVFAWELSLAFWLIIKGFRPTTAGEPAGASPVPSAV